MKRTLSTDLTEEILKIIFKYIKEKKMSISEIAGVLESVKLSLFMSSGMHIHITMDKKAMEQLEEILNELKEKKKEKLNYIG